MGSAVSTSFRVSEVDSECETPSKHRSNSFSGNRYIIKSAPSTRYFMPSTEPCTTEVIENAWRSWMLLNSQDHKERTNNIILDINLIILESENSDKVIQILNSSDKNTFLHIIINYMLSIDVKSARRTRNKLRALGRAHARIGIVKEHFEIFFDGFIGALLKHLQFVDTILVFTLGITAQCVIDSWCTLMSFVLEHMTFDKIIFKPHASLPPSSMIATTPTSTSTTDSTSTSTDSSDALPLSIDCSRLPLHSILEESGTSRSGKVLSVTDGQSAKAFSAILQLTAPSDT